MTISNKPELIDRLTDSLLQIFSAGFTLDRDAVHFLNSTYDIQSSEDFSGFISESDPDDLYTALELILFPREKDQIELEPVISGYDFSEKDLESLYNNLTKAIITTQLRYSEESCGAKVEIPHDILHLYILRLKLTSSPPPEFTSEIKNFTGSNHSSVCVKLRNSRIGYNTNIKLFLSRYFTSTENSYDNLCKLNIILLILEEAYEKCDIFNLFLNKREEYVRQIEAAKKLEEELKKSNFETMIMKGARISSGNIDELSRKLNVADSVLINIYGHFPIDSKGYIENDLEIDDIDTDEGISKTLKFLGGS